MARVTVEDCIVKIPNRFELVLIASQRVRDINGGSAITVDRDRDKNPVVALREIADNTISLEDLKEGLVKRNQRTFIGTEAEEEQIDVIEGEEAWANMAREALETGESSLNFDADDEGDSDPSGFDALMQGEENDEDGRF